MSDESVVNLSNDTKADLRRYFTMSGFFLMFVLQLIALVNVLKTGNAVYAGYECIEIILAISILVSGVVLALLHKRDLFALFFILFAVMTIIIRYAGDSSVIAVDLIFFPLAVMFLITKNEQAKVLSVLCILIGLLVFRNVNGMDAVIIADLGFLAILPGYFALILGCEKFKFRLYDILVADEDDESNDGMPVHFKTVGSILGYLLIAIMPLAEIAQLLTDGVIISSYSENLSMVIGLMMVIVGFVMLVAGRMRFTPIMFWMIGTLFLIHPYCGDITVGWFICLVMIALLIMLHGESRKMAGCTLIFYMLGLIFGYAYCETGANSVPLMACAVLMFVISFILCEYICFALHSNGKLKLY